MYTIKKRFDFCAGHSLTHLKDGHPCKRPHGHNYQVIVALAGEKVSDIDRFILDYRGLDDFKRYIDNELDHQMLNDVIPGGGPSTTAENLARWLFEQFELSYKQVMEDRDIELASMAVKETEKTEAAYSRQHPYVNLIVELTAKALDDAMSVSRETMQENVAEVKEIAHDMLNDRPALVSRIEALEEQVAQLVDLVAGESDA